MTDLIKQHLNYEIKENQEEYKDRLLDHILEVEEDLLYYCNSLTGHSTSSEEEAIDTLKNFINDMSLDEVFAKLKQRGIWLIDTVIENEDIYLSISSNNFTPVQLLEMFNEKNFKMIKKP